MQRHTRRKLAAVAPDSRPDPVVCSFELTLLCNYSPHRHHHYLFSFRRSVQDYKIQKDMEIVTF